MSYWNPTPWEYRWVVVVGPDGALVMDWPTPVSILIELALR